MKDGIKNNLENFEKRRDRYELFQGFENPLLNITSRLEVQNFLPYCQRNNIPPFHFFLFHVLKSTLEIENFRYRELNGEIFLIDHIKASYTLMGEDDLFNYAIPFDYSDDFDEFLNRSLESKEKSEKVSSLNNANLYLSPEELKQQVYITCLPWLNFTSIQHPLYKANTLDIPCVAWGKFEVDADKLNMPFSVQVHHGFVDGIHIHQIIEAIKESIVSVIS